MSTSGTKSSMTRRRKDFNSMRRITKKLKDKKPLTEQENDLFRFESYAAQPGIGDKAIRTGWTQDEYTHGMSIELGQEWGKKYKQASPERKREIIEMYLNNEINPEPEGE